MHPSDGVQVACRNENEVAWHWLALDHRARAPLALPQDAKLALLKRSQEALLALNPQHVYLIDEQNALIGLVNGTGLEALVRRSLEAAALERIVLDISQQRARVRACCVYERGHLVRLVGYDKLGDEYRLLPLSGIPEQEEQEYPAHHPDQKRRREALNVRKERSHHYEHDDQHQGRGVLLGLLLLSLEFLRLNNLLSLARWEYPDFGLVVIVRVVIGYHILEFALGQEVRHGSCQHRLACPRLSYEYHMSLLLCRLPDDQDGIVLANDLVYEL